MQSSVVPAIVIRRVLSASPERVYQAWTDPKLAAQFLCPAETTIDSVAFDVRAGGAYHIAFRRPQGDVWTVRGVYREVRPNSRLSMTWKWDEEDPSAEQETLLTIDFAPHGSGTEITLTHEQFKSVESRNNHEQGWNSMLDKLEALR